MTLGRVLVIAGSDSGGGAGIQGDIKTITSLAGYASTAITALTAQNTQGVFGIQDVPDHFIRQQVTLVLDDIGTDCIKTGMLHKQSVIETVAGALASHAPDIPLVLDPVMFAKGGAALLEPSALDCLRTVLIPHARIITPNIPEAEFLSGMDIHSVSDMKKAAEKILSLGCQNVLLKGGHLQGDTLTDILSGQDGEHAYGSARIATTSTHGTGCTLASAIATGIAQQMPLTDAVRRARDYVQEAIKNAPKLGHGHGPLKHNYAIQ